MDSHTWMPTALSVHGKLLLLLIIIFLPTFGTIVISGVFQREDVIKRSKDNALLMVRSMAAQQELIATSARVMLRTLAHLQEMRNLDSDALNSLFREIHNRYPLYAAILGDMPARIKGDQGRFRQVQVNLMGNAAKFTEAGEIELSIAVEARDEHRVRLHITVRDTGIGIPADKLKTIFEAFRRPGKVPHRRNERLHLKADQTRKCSRSD